MTNLFTDNYFKGQNKSEYNVYEAVYDTVYLFTQYYLQ